MADELKAKGNAAFSSGSFVEAIGFFTEAIAIDPSNHVFYSNRSACQASLRKWDEALKDAKKCVEVKPDWPKGYSRLGGALFGKGEYQEAVDAYKQGLEIDSSNVTLQSGLKDAEQALARPRPGAGAAAGGLFGPQFLAKLAMNPETRPFLEQPDFRAMLADCSTDASKLTQYMRDPRFAKALEVGMGLSFGMPSDMGGAGEGEDDEQDVPGLSEVTGARDVPRASAKPRPPPQDNLSEEEKTEKKQKAQAQQEKEAGNAAYKQKDFDAAIAHYNKAIELYDKDISFITNRAAVHFERMDFDAAIEDCELAVERGRELRADFKMLAKAMTRHGNCLIKKDDLEGAVEMLNRALTEHRTADTLKLRDSAERTLKQRREESYVDLTLADEAKNKGNDAFKAADYPKAVAHYSEALRRGPAGKWDEAYKVYSNRAACYTKLGALPDGEKDADMCIDLKPDFAKGYSRKAHVQFFMKEFEKAMETYEKGLTFDPANQELKDGVLRCQQQLARFLNGTATEEEINERQAKAMADPEIQHIMTDPVMQQVLKDCQENPGSAAKHMRNPGIGAKMRKLMTAGIIRMA